MMERNQKSYDKLLRELRPILVRHYGTERAEKMIRDTGPIYDRFLTELPSIGGRENPMNKNMDMALPFFALYEASGHTLSGEIIEEMCATPLGKICASDHAMNALDEMSALNRDMKAFFEEVGAPYETWKQVEKTAAKYLK